MGLSGIQIMDDWDEFPAACMTTSATVDAAPMVALNHMFYGLVGELSEHAEEIAGSSKALSELADIFWYVGMGFTAMQTMGHKTNFGYKGFGDMLDELCIEAKTKADQHVNIQAMQLDLFRTIGHLGEVLKKIQFYGRKDYHALTMELKYTLRGILVYIHHYLKMFHPNLTLFQMANALIGKLHIRFKEQFTLNERDNAQKHIEGNLFDHLVEYDKEVDTLTESVMDELGLTTDLK